MFGCNADVVGFVCLNLFSVELSMLYACTTSIMCPAVASRMNHTHLPKFQKSVPDVCVYSNILFVTSNPVPPC